MAATKTTKRAIRIQQWGDRYDRGEPMTHAEFEAARAALGATQSEFARMLGISYASACRYGGGRRAGSKRGRPTSGDGDVARVIPRQTALFIAHLLG